MDDLYDADALKRAGWRQLDSGLWWHPSKGLDTYLGTVADQIRLTEEIVDEIVREES